MKQKKKYRKIVTTIIWLVFVLTLFFYFVSKAKAPNTQISNSKPETEISAETYISSTIQNPETTFAFAGDMMFDRYVYHVFKTKGLNHIFDNLDKSLFADKDISFANLEGPVSQDKTVDDYPERSLVFNMPPETIATLQNLGLNSVSLANNHTLNAGQSGFATTKNLLAAANIRFAGSYGDFNETDNVIRYETKIPVSIICVDYLAFSDNDKISAVISAEKERGNFVIIFPHWGTEYELTHTTSQETAAKIWLDAGADLVIGSHPHVVEDVGVYKNKLIFYSLGNFVFDQTFSTDTQQGLILTSKITNTSLEIKLYPTQSKNLQPEIATENVKNTILNRILSSKNLAPFLSDDNTITISQ